MQVTNANAMQESKLERGSDPRREGLAIEGKRYVVRDHMAAVIQLALTLAAARTIDWLNAWLYVALLLAVKITSALVLLRINPAVLNARGTKREMSRQEKLFFAVFVPASLALPIVAGLDAGGAGWSHHSMAELVIGCTLMIAGMGVLIWALAVNAFFEPTVRIQRDRAHRVCSAGPYRYVRHPGYAGVLVGTAGIPLILGSYWCFVPFALVVLAFVVRTRYEDSLLHRELDGYQAYAANTRSRLVPFIW